MKSLTLYPSRLKTLRLFFTSLTFSVGAFFMLLQGEKLGWLPFLFFGIGTLVSVTKFFGGSTLKITEEGLEIKALYRRDFIPWGAVDYFEPCIVGVLPMVGIVYSTKHHKNETAKKVARFLSDGTEAALPDTYGKSAEELSHLLNEWKSKIA